MADWADKYSNLKTVTYKFSEFKEWRFTLEEHKEKGTLQINARLWTLPKKEDGYAGPSKNGFIIQISSADDFDNIVKCFSEFTKFVEDCKEFI